MAGAIAAITGGAKSLYEGLKPLDIPVRQLDADETAAAARATGSNRKDSPELREKFDEFVAGTFAKTMLKSLRKTTARSPTWTADLPNRSSGNASTTSSRRSSPRPGSVPLGRSVRRLFAPPPPRTPRDPAPTAPSNTAPSEETEHVLSVVL